MPGGRKQAAEDTGPYCPDELVHVWNWFAEIISGVAPNGMGPSQVTWRDVLAWSQLTGEQPSAFEVRVILGLSGKRVEVLESER